jgi:RHS repeat-associated protein
MERFFLIFLFVSFNLCANWDYFFSEEEDPALFHHVNVMTGHLSLFFQDTIVQGAKPLSLTRTYSSTGAFERTPGNEDLRLKSVRDMFFIQGGWNFFPQTNLLIKSEKKYKDFKIYVAEPSGRVLSYVYSHKTNHYTLYFKPQESAYSCCNLSAKTNTDNNLLLLNTHSGEAILYLPSGGWRHYKGKKFSHESAFHSYRLISETSASRHVILYSYDRDHDIKRIALTNQAYSKTFASLDFNLERTKTPYRFQIRTSDEKIVRYQALKYKERDYLSEVESNFRPKEITTYYPSRKGLGARMSGWNVGGVSQFRVTYFLPDTIKKEKKWEKHPEEKEFSIDKVSSLEAPLGIDGELIPIAHFSYAPNLTEVRDVDHCLIRYRHEGGKLLSVEYFDKEDKPVSSLKLLWNDRQLKAKILCDGAGQPHFSKTFRMDGAGNVLEETLWGNFSAAQEAPFILKEDGSLEGAESYQKRYRYHLNRCIFEEEDAGLTYLYVYEGDTDLLTAKFTCDGESILKREFYFYDGDHLLIEEISDDGTSRDPQDLTSVAERHVKRILRHPTSGLPQQIVMSYYDARTAGELQLLRTELTYNHRNQLIAEAIYDAEDRYRYMLSTDYDHAGRVLRRTNPLGRENTYRYDEFGNCVEEKEVGKPRKISRYDTVGRLYLMDENGKGTRTTFDAKGRLLSQIDFRGNETQQTYDSFGHCIETIFPAVCDEEGCVYSPRLVFTYDLQGNLASTTTPKNETVRTVYNLYRKPTLIIQPDGAETRHRYDKNGALAVTQHADGTEIHYTYDHFQRVTSKKTFSREKALLSQESWGYSAFQLIAYTDPRGLTTTYVYDGAGRKIAEEAQGRRKSYSYDALGFLERSQEDEKTGVQVHNEAGLIVKEWETDEKGVVENEVSYVYDAENRKEKALRQTAQGEAVDHFGYDEEGRVIRHVDPLGAVTEFIYDEAYQNNLGQRVLQKTSIDPLGNVRVETYDVQTRLVSVEKRDIQGRSHSYEAILYDRSGNQVERRSTLYREGEPVKSLSVKCEYDTCGRLVAQIEPNEKITTYAYDNKGRLQRRRAPSGVELTFVYDGLDRLVREWSTDETLDLQYDYEAGSSDPILVIDHQKKTKLERSYNAFGELVRENNNGITTSWDYDVYGRCVRFTLPDRSAIVYRYEGSHLGLIGRYSSDQQLLYEHRYTHFDVNGHVEEEELIHDLGRLRSRRDLLERPSSQWSSFLSHTIAYGVSGLVLQVNNSLFGAKKYRHDALNQLLQEGEESYRFDSLGNPIECMVNDGNQIVATASEHLTYDSNGNPVQRESDGGQTRYTYDALDRLTSISAPGEAIYYAYDPLSRLYAKTIHKNGERETLFYLHDQENEIGTLSKDGVILELKVLGLGIKGDIGAAVAIESGKRTYAPLHDFNGNLVALVDSLGEIVETYEHGAFGKERVRSYGGRGKKPISPWRFCSKRSEKGLVYFGRRFYDPSLGRWLTPDPAGFVDGLNLYLYVLNSPINRLDLYGLFEEMRDHRLSVLHFQMPIPLKSSFNLSQVFWGKLYLENGHKTDFLVAGADLYKLSFRPEELETGKFDLLDHFIEFTPKTGMMIGCITMINGINTSRREYAHMCKSVSDQIPGSIVIGIYNQSKGLIRDFFRVRSEQRDVETSITALARQFMVSIIEQAHKINPQMLIEHISHSEGGAISNLSLRGMTPEQKELMRQHLISYNIAPAVPIAKDFAFNVINVYSKRDYVTKWFALPYRNDPNYNIRFIPCKSSWREKTLFIADHGFMKPTYQTDLKANITHFGTEYGYYHVQKR